MARDVRVNIVGDTRSLERAVARADDRLEHLGTSARRMQTALAAALAGGAAIRGVQSIVRTYEGYDTALRDVGAVSDTSGRKLQAMGDIARKVGLDTGAGAKASTEAMAELAKAGLSAAEIGPALSGTLALAQAGGMETAEAATAAANAMGQFGLAGKDATRIADALANAANQTTGDVSDFAQALSQGGGAARAAGLSFDDTILALAQLQRSSVKGSDAGTSLKSALSQVAKPTAESAKAMKKLGIEFFDASGKVKSVSELSGMLHDKLGGLTKQQRLATLTTIAGTDGMRALNAMSQMTAAQSEALGEKLRKQGSAAETAKAKQSGFAGSMNQLRASSEELQIQLGERLAPRIAGVADELGKLARDPAAQERLMSVLDAGIDTVERFGEALSPVVGLAGDLAGVFSDLPSGVQQAAIQMTVLSALAGKLAGPTGFGGAGAGVARFRHQLAQVPADARRAETALAATSTSAVAAPARRPAKAAAAVTMVPAGMLGATGRDALEMRAVSSAEAAERTTLAQRAQSDAARKAVAARQALAAAEIAEVNAERRALTARAASKGAASKAHVSASQQELLAARQTHAAALEAATAAKAESAAARQRLTTARTVQRMAASTATQAAASAAVVAPASGARSRLAGLAGRLPARSGRAAMGGVAAGGVGAALSGGDMLAGALSGAALGSMAGPVGIAAGAVVGAGATALANEFSKRGVKETEAAARKFARDAAGATDKAAAAGFASAPARQIGRGVAGARKAQATGRKDTSLIAGGAMDAYEGAARDFLSPLGLMDSRADVDRKRARENAKKAAAEQKANARLVLSAYEQEIKGYKFTNATAAIRQFSAAWRDPALPKAARQAAANALIAQAREMERSGAAPKGTVDKLIRSLGRRFDGLAPQVRGAGVDSMRALDRALASSAVVTNAKKTVNAVGRAFKGLMPALPVNDIKTAAASLRSRMSDLTAIVKDNDAPKAMRDQAAKALPAVRRAYKGTLDDLSSDFGGSRKKADEWARRVAAAAKTAGGGRTDVDALTAAVGRLNAKLDEAADKQLMKKVDPASPLWQVGLVAEPAAGKKGGKKAEKRRRGGMISRFAGGGHVDALMSGGEEYLPPEVASRYPAGVLDTIAQIQAPHFARGGPVGRRAQRYNLGGMIVPGPSDRDGTYVPAEDGGFVLTGHGRQLRDEMLGFRRGGALRRFAGGGLVRGRTSWFGGPNDKSDSGRTALGLTTATPGVAIRPGATYNSGQATLGGYWRTSVRGRSATLRQTDIGPHEKTGRRIDFTYSALPQLGFSERNFPTDSIATAEYLGKGAKAARRARAATSSAEDATIQVRRTFGRSTTRGGLLEDPYSVGFGAVDLWGSRANARKYGSLGRSALREALDAQADSYTRSVTVPGRTKGASGKLGKGSPGGTWLRPVGGTQSGAFGTPRPGHTHAGLDLAVPVGTPVHATRPGRSLGPQSDPGGYGTYTSIQHGGGYLSLYGHMSSIAARAGQAVKRGQTIGRSGNTGRSSGPHVHFEVRRNGTAVNPAGLLGKAYRGGGAVGAIQRFAAGGPTKAMRTSLAAVRKSTSDVNLDAFDAAIGAAGIARVEAMRTDLLAKARKGGDRQAVARIQAAISVIEVDIAGRIQEKLSGALGSRANFDSRKRQSQHAMAMEGVDESSAAGLQRATTTNETSLDVDKAARDELARGRAAAKRELRKATTAQGRETLANKIKEFGSAIAEIDDRVLGTKEEIAAAKRALPQAQAAKRVQGLEFGAAMAGLTPDVGDDRANLVAQQAEWGKQLQEAIKLGPAGQAWATEAANTLRGINDSISQIDETLAAAPRQQADSHMSGLDYRSALAALTDDGGADDMANLRDMEAAWQAQLDEAQRTGQQAWAKDAAIGLKGVRDSISSLDETIKQQQEADRERQERDAELTSLLKQQVENQQKLLNGSATSRDALVAAIGAAASGYVGQSVTRGSASPAFAGNGVSY